MELEQYLDKTDLLLYNKILKLIIRDWDNMEPQRLSDLLDKLRELHTTLDQVVQQKKQKNLFTKRYYKSNFDRGSLKETISNNSISLKDIYRGIKHK